MYLREVLEARNDQTCRLSAWYRRRASAIVESEVRIGVVGPGSGSDTSQGEIRGRRQEDGAEAAAGTGAGAAGARSQMRDARNGKLD